MGEILEFNNVFPLEHLQTAAKIFKREKVTKRQGAIAFLNIQSYGFGAFLPIEEEDLPLMKATGPNIPVDETRALEICEELINDFKQPDGPQRMMAAAGEPAKKVRWQQLLQALLQLLPLLL